MSVHKIVTDHYAKKGSEEVSEANQHLHIGGAKATGYVLDKMNLSPNMRVLDIGCGVGGPAIYAAENYGCFVTGIDLTPEFIELASERTALGPHRDKLYFQVADAAGLDFKDESFDAIFMMHTGMNIPNKQEVYHEAARTLKSGGKFLIYDILNIGDSGGMRYPVPWAKDESSSFLVTLPETEKMLRQSGFEITLTENAHDYAKAAVTKLLENADGSVNAQREKIMRNLKTNLDAGLIAPHILIMRKI